MDGMASEDGKLDAADQKDEDAVSDNNRFSVTDKESGSKASA